MRGKGFCLVSCRLSYSDHLSSSTDFIVLIEEDKKRETML